jgi:hypothetical protein
MLCLGYQGDEWRGRTKINHPLSLIVVKTNMASHWILMLVLGFLIFTLGGLARAYENIKIKQFLKEKSSFFFTEGVYWNLIKNGKTPLWPFIVAITCIPLGILISFLAILIAP